MKSPQAAPPHWLLVPGGPGIECGYLASLAKKLKLPGTTTPFDLPREEKSSLSETYASWRKSLCEAAARKPNTILLCHSFGGMLALNTPELQKICAGAVFLDSSPSRGWEAHAGAAATKVKAPDEKDAEAEFKKNPSDETVKRLCLSWVPYYFLPEYHEAGKNVLLATTYNYVPYKIAGDFFTKYKSTWTNWDFPTLCLAGDQDLITPLDLFRDDPRFNDKENVNLVEIKNAGHFPWVENFAGLQTAMQNYLSSLG